MKSNNSYNLNFENFSTVILINFSRNKDTNYYVYNRILLIYLT